MSITDDNITATASLSVTDGDGGPIFAQVLPAASKAFVNGRLGVGTVNPQSPLDVSGAARITGDLTLQGALVGSNVVQSANLRDGAVTLAKLAVDARAALAQRLNGAYVHGLAEFSTDLPTEAMAAAGKTAALAIDPTPPPPFPLPIQPISLLVANRDLRGKLIGVIGFAGSAVDTTPDTLGAATNAKAWDFDALAKQIFAYCKSGAPNGTALELLGLKVPEFPNQAQFRLRFFSTQTLLEITGSPGLKFGYAFQLTWEE